MKDALNRMSRFWYHRSLGLLLIRVATGLVFLVHGWEKIHNIEGVSGMMMHLGVVAPSFFGPFVAWIEVIGGLMLILGIVTRPAAVALGIDMLFAIFLTGLGRGFHAHEFEMLLMATSFGIALMGSGAFSLYRLECHHCGGILCNGVCPAKVKV